MDPVKADICFVEASNEPLISWPSEAGGRSERRSGVYRERTVSIHDARVLNPAPDLEREGFLLAGHRPAIDDFLNDAELKTVYEPELQGLLADLTGAEKVVVFDHTRRAGDEGIRARKQVREPVHLAHSDYTGRSGPQKLIDFLPAAEARERLGRRFAIINVWRSMAGPIDSSPIALCDAGTVDPENLLRIERRSRDRVGEIFGLEHHADQRWFWFPRMRMDESLVFKCFDSATDGRARMCPHTAFTDPAAPPDAPPRQSIESRCLVLYER